MFVLILLLFIGSVRADLVGWWPLDETFDAAAGGELSGEALGAPDFEQGSWLRLNEGDADGVTIRADERLDAEVFSLGYGINLDGKTQSNAGPIQRGPGAIDQPRRRFV